MTAVFHTSRGLHWSAAFNVFIFLFWVNLFRFNNSVIYLNIRGLGARKKVGRNTTPIAVVEVWTVKQKKKFVRKKK